VDLLNHPPPLRLPQHRQLVTACRRPTRARERCEERLWPRSSCSTAAICGHSATAGSGGLIRGPDPTQATPYGSSKANLAAKRQGGPCPWDDEGPSQQKLWGLHRRPGSRRTRRGPCWRTPNSARGRLRRTRAHMRRALRSFRAHSSGVRGYLPWHSYRACWMAVHRCAPWHSCGARWMAVHA
jgi:hypothetical protein